MRWGALATVHGDLPGAVFERRIAEAGDETVGIGQQINAGNGQRRSLFVKHQLAGGAAEDVIRMQSLMCACPAR